MAEIRITGHHFDDDPDFDQFYMLINSAKPVTSVAYPVDEQRDFHLQIDPHTRQVVGAFVYYAADWFAELADAFARRDLDHPDVRFFFEQKIKVLAEQWAAEPQSAAPAEESAMPTEGYRRMVKADEQMDDTVTAAQEAEAIPHTEEVAVSQRELQSVASGA